MSWYRYGSNEHVLDNLVGKKITAINWSEERIVFETDGGTFAYDVEGDCCSYSYFHDFFGVEHLLANGPVVSVGDVELHDDDPRFSHPVNEVPEGTDPDDVWKYQDDCIRVYGYELVTEHPLFGEVTSVLSFRNSSNGYYGGWMDRTDNDTVDADFKQLTKDFVGD